MRIVVDGRDFLRGELVVNFEGVTTYGEKISLHANYDRDLKMTGCSGAYSSMNNARYYVEVAEYFKAMLELEGSKKLEETFKQVEDIEKKYDDEKECMYDELKKVKDDIDDVTSELSKMNETVANLNSQVRQFEKSLKRCTKQSSIDDKQKAIDGLKEQIEVVEMMNRNRKNELRKSLSFLRCDERKIAQKIDEHWYKCREEIKIEILDTNAIDDKNTVILNSIDDVNILDDILNNMDNRNYIKDLVKDFFDNDTDDEEYELRDCFLNRWNYAPDSVLVDLDTYKIIEL